MESQLLPMQQAPPLREAEESKGKTESIQLGSSCAAGVAGEDDTMSGRLRDSSSGFSVRVYSLSLSPKGVCRKAAEVWNQSCLLLDELPSKVDEPHLPEATGFEAPEDRLCPFSC
jgi:hypothetical protein